MGPFAWLVLFIKPNTTTQPDANPAPPAPARVVPPPTHTGFVYLLSNPAMPGLVKIGQTIRPVEARVAELSAYTGVPAPFVIEVTFASHNPVADEKRVHTHLALDRLQAQREFFRMEVPQAIETITRICGGPPHYCRRQAAHERGERP
jgi:hypothetical protein